MGEYDIPVPPNPMDDAITASEVTANVPFVFITVDDMARSLTFYEHLGFKFPSTAYSQSHVQAELKNGLLIFWNQIDTVLVYAPDYRPAAHGRVGLSFQLESPAEVDSLFAKLKRLGHRGDRTPWDAPWGHHYAIIYDPDGNSINLFAPHG